MARKISLMINDSSTLCWDINFHLNMKVLTWRQVDISCKEELQKCYKSCKFWLSLDGLSWTPWAELIWWILAKSWKSRRELEVEHKRAGSWAEEAGNWDDEAIMSWEDEILNSQLPAAWILFAQLPNYCWKMNGHSSFYKRSSIRKFTLWNAIAETLPLNFGAATVPKKFSTCTQQC